MPGKVLILNAVGIVLQYTLIVLLYYFLVRVVRLVWADLNNWQAVPQYQPNTIAAEQYMPEVAKLVVVDSGSVSMSSTEYRLGETVAMGRNDTNDIVINDGFVSHEHACITRYKHEFWLTDLQSTNGTYLNSHQVKDEVKLKNGDHITIGAVTFRFER